MDPPGYALWSWQLDPRDDDLLAAIEVKVLVLDGVFVLEPIGFELLVYVFRR